MGTRPLIGVTKNNGNLLRRIAKANLTRSKRRYTDKEDLTVTSSVLKFFPPPTIISNSVLQLLEFEGIAMASEVLISISRDEVERARLTSEYKYVVDHQSKMVQAERRGRAERRAERRAEGRNELLDLLESGKSTEEILKTYRNKTL
ncbi:MAG: hypothetical protein Ta2G_14180 [Termitinemataceae bacterium]|nr:MAG: hypothetical protein Ta2G_14180 [Termitinemataceae bacterium]